MAYQHKSLTNGSTQTPKPTRFLWVSLRSLYHKKLSGLGAGEPGVVRFRKWVFSKPEFSRKINAAPGWQYAK